MCRFRLLGSIEVATGGRTVSIGGTRQLALLAFMLLNAGRRISGEELVASVWEAEPTDGARTRTQVAITRLRRALDEAGVSARIETVGGGYRFDSGSELIDVEVFVAASRCRAASTAAS